MLRPQRRQRPDSDQRIDLAIGLRLEIANATPAEREQITEIVRRAGRRMAAEIADEAERQGLDVSELQVDEAEHEKAPGR